MIYGSPSTFSSIGATSKQKLMNHPKTDKSAGNLYYTDNVTDTVIIEYWMDNGYGYAKEMNYYFQLQYLAGYDVMEGVARGDSVGNIERSIAKRYGTETAATVMELLEMIYEADEEDEALEKDTDDGLQMDCALCLERTILKCIESDLDKLKTKEEVEIFTNRYRAYMIHLLPRVYRDFFTEITYEPEYLPEAAELDHKMADKIVQTGAFGIQSFTAADTLVFTTTDELKREEWIYVSYYVPPDLFNAAFWEDDDGALWLHYEDYNPFDGFRNVYVYLKKGRKDAKAQIDYGYAVEGLRPFFPDAPEVTTLLRSDGSRYKAIILPAGGFRDMNPGRERFLCSDGIERSLYDIYMDGTSVFSFSITDVPKALNDYLEYTGTSAADYDSFIFHQANEFVCCRSIFYI